MSGPPDPFRDEGLTRGAAEDIRTVAKGGAVQIAGQVVSRSLSFLFYAVAFRLVGVATVGRYRQVSQALTIAGQVALLGFNYAAMRFIARARAQGRHEEVRGAMRVAVTGVLLASLFVTVAIVVLAEPLGRLFAEEGQDPGSIATFFRIGVAYVPLFALTQVLRYCTQAYKTMVPSVMVGGIIQPVARFVFGIALLIAGLAVTGLLASLVVSVAVGAVAAAWYVRRMLTEDERAASPRADAGAMVRFALPQAGASLLSIQDLGLGIILLGVSGTDLQVGVFTAGLALQGPATVFLGGIVNIWAPVVSDLHGRGEIGRLGDLYKTINRWVATFSFPVIAVLILEGDLFIELFAKTRDPSAGAVVVWLAIGNIFYTGTGPTGYVLSMTGRPGVNFMNSAVGVALYIVLGLWVIPEHGVVGMAIVTAGITAAVNLARVIEAKILVGIQPFGRTFYKPVVATLGGSAVLLAWRLVPGESIPIEIAGILLGALAYLAILKMLGLDPEERHVYDRIRKRMFRRSAGKGGDGDAD
ncbi:MAG: oligosaccharide flippase family protein [Actinobacteria bacterium]|nr:oligosaccharide flippase family protein [Actinomycetota bacterium]